MTDYLEVAKQLNPPDEDEIETWNVEGFPSVYEYQPIIDYLGKVAIQLDDNDYQGDTRVLYVDDEKGFGYLTFGWGSCSGCDALQRCDTYQDLATLIENLDNSIKWAPREEMLTFFKEHDWEGDFGWSHNEQEMKDFVAQVISFLEPLNDGRQTES